MNKTHRIVWNESRNAFVVAHEKTATRGKPSTRKVAARAVTAALLTLAGNAAFAVAPCGLASTTTTIADNTLNTTTCSMDNGSSLEINATTHPANTGISVSSSPGVQLDAVDIGANTTAGHITNNGGSIVTTGGGNAINFGTDGNLHGGTLTGGITNTGNISSEWSAVDGMYATVGNITNSGTMAGSIYWGIHFNQSNLTGGIHNSGTLSGPSGRGIKLQNSTLANGITNTKLIDGSEGGIELYHSTLTGGILNLGGTISGGRAIEMNNAVFTGNISNTGTIAGGSSHGIYLTNFTTLTGDIVNSGIISGMAAVGVAMYGSTLTGTIANNSGAIRGVTAILLSNATVGGITNSGAIVGGQASIYTDATTTLPTILNQSGGLIDGTLSILSNTNVTNAGTISLPETSQSTIAGNFTQTSTGLFKIGASSDTSYSKLGVGGTASLAGNAYVNVAGVNTLAVGQTLSGVISAGAVSGNFGSVRDNSALVNFESHVNGNQVDIYVVDTPSTSVTQSAMENSNSPAVSGVAPVLDHILGNTPAGMEEVVTKLNQLPTTKAVSDAATQTLPLLTGASVMSAGSALSSVNKVVQARIESAHGLSAGDSFYSDKHFWLKPFGSWADQDDRHGISGYKASVAGIAVGVDGAVSEASRIGASFAYANAHVKGNSSIAPNSANTDVYVLIGYGSYRLASGAELSYQGDYGNNKNEGRRSVLFMGTTATSSFTTQTAHVGAGIGKGYELSDKTTFTPSVRLDYTHMRDAAYQETGADVLNLKVNGRTTEELILSGEGKVSYKLNEGTTLLTNAGLGYDTKAKTAQVVAAFAGAPGMSFTTTGMKAEPWLVRGGLGFVHNPKNGPEITARYDIEHRQGFNNQTISAKARWAF